MEKLTTKLEHKMNKTITDFFGLGEDGSGLADGRGMGSGFGDGGLGSGLRDDDGNGLGLTDSYSSGDHLGIGLSKGKGMCHGTVNSWRYADGRDRL